MPKFIQIGGELIEIYPTDSGLNTLIPPNEATTQIIAKLDRVIELLEQVLDELKKGKPPK